MFSSVKHVCDRVRSSLASLDSQPLIRAVLVIFPFLDAFTRISILHGLSEG